MAPRILLLQARDADDPMRRSEVLSFARTSGLAPEQFGTHDLLTGPPDLEQVLAHDALMVGGSGDYYVSRRDLPEFDALLDALRRVVDAGHPTFASCFGFQLLTVALGGEIVHDPDTTEVGTYELRLTDPGARDPLLGRLPARFMAQLGRKDRASRLPDGLEPLASSALNPHQAFRVPDKPVWATQFHPELDVESNRERYLRYLEGYAQHLDEDARREADQRFHPSPEASSLIPTFLELVFGPTGGRTG